MIRCPNCNHTYLDGTLFCAACGAALSTDLLADEKQTDPLCSEQDRRGIGTRPMDPTTVAAETSASEEVPPGTLAVWVVPSQRRQLFEMNSELLIGRLDSANGVYPNLDLTTDGGFEGGVSRRHARITFRDGVPYLEDLKSTNHTYLNNVCLEPLIPYPLHHGDEVRVGTMLLRVALP